MTNDHLSVTIELTKVVQLIGWLVNRLINFVQAFLGRFTIGNNDISSNTLEPLFKDGNMFKIKCFIKKSQEINHCILNDAKKWVIKFVQIICHHPLVHKF